MVDAPLTLASGSSEPADNNNSVSDYSIIGEIFHSYILVESGEELIIIDKHAAHERMIFDSMKNDPSSSSSSAQVLLEPIVVSLSPEDSAVFSANINLFWEIGFDASDFGSNFIILRQVPCCINEEDIPAMLTELCEELRNGKRLSPSDTKDKIISSLACKAAIKAGWKNDVKEFIPIVEQVLSGKVLYCPHGRPVSLRISKSSMDKNFKRT